MNIDVLKDLSPAEPASAGDLPPFGLFAAGVYPFLEFRWFHEAYYRVLEAFAAGRVRRLIVTMPPQHGKSVGASTLLPAYLLGRNPDLRIAIASYSASLASKFNRRVQRIIDSPEYAAFFPETTIKRGARPPEYLRTADEVEIIGHRGGLLSVGREGALTGNRVDCFILDDLYKGKIFDPACGSGGMFVQSSKFIERHRGNINQISVYGQELNSNTWRLAQMNLAICGIEANFGDSSGDSFHDDKHPFLKADFVMANPPFNISKWGGDQLRDDPRWQYGIPPEGNANFAWMQHMLYHLADNGRIGLVLANGSLSSQQGTEGEIRKNIVKADLVESIIAMPSQLFYNVQIPCCLWFLTKKKAQPGKTLFIDARNMGYMKDRTHRELSCGEETEDHGNDIARIADTFEQFRAGTLETEKGFSAIATIQDIEKQDFILTPGRYVGIAEVEEDGEPFQEKMERLTSELSDLFAQSHTLEDEIRKRLASIGFTVK